MAIEKELLDQLLAGRDPKALFGKDGLLPREIEVLFPPASKPDSRAVPTDARWDTGCFAINNPNSTY